MSLLIDLTKSVRGKDISKVSNQVYAKRVETCAACPFLNKTTGSCGTLFKGGTVDYEGQQMELCGCIVKDKAKYADDGCPLGKW